MEAAGVRQGAILSPLEFLIFINDLAQGMENTGLGCRLDRTQASLGPKALLYADDLVLTADSISAMEAGLTVVSEWAARWRLTFGRGKDKSAAMIFPGPIGEGNSLFSLMGERLPWTNSYTYLGISIRADLNMIDHVRTIAAASTRRFFQVCGWARREGLPVHTVASLVNTYVVPKILFGMELCVHSAPCMDLLNKLQRKLRRWILQDSGAPPTALSSGTLRGDRGPPSHLKEASASYAAFMLHQSSAPRPRS